MRRRPGQSGQIIRKGKTWHVRFYVDVPGQLKRLRKSVAVGPAVGKERLTKPEAVRKAAEIIQGMGVNTAEHLEQAIRPERVTTFEQRVELTNGIRAVKHRREFDRLAVHRYSRDFGQCGQRRSQGQLQWVIVLFLNLKFQR